MHVLAVLAEEQPQFDPNQVTPGVVGFVITFLVAIAALLLIFDMVRRVRRVNYRQQARDKIRAEQSAEQNPSTDDADGARSEGDQRDD